MKSTVEIKEVTANRLYRNLYETWGADILAAIISMWVDTTRSRIKVQEGTAILGHIGGALSKMAFWFARAPRPFQQILKEHQGYSNTGYYCSCMHPNRQ